VPRAVGQRGEHEERLPRHGPASHDTNIVESKILGEQVRGVRVRVLSCKGLPVIKDAIFMEKFDIK
jgi:hypothetical protein